MADNPSVGLIPLKSVYAADVADLEVMQMDVSKIADVFCRHLNGPADFPPLVIPSSAVGICDRQVANFPVVLIVESDGIFDLSFTVDNRVGPLSVFIDRDRFAVFTRPIRMQLSKKHLTRLEQDLVAGFEFNLLDFLQRLPRGFGRFPVASVAPLLCIDMVTCRVHHQAAET
ncbi:MAG: hypothetical protein HN759_06935 [Akkermansiaceae bacterium]|nr:hypothetical protein [Akkermansiaceae bacterium]